MESANIIDTESRRRKSANVRTALVLLSVAIIFFIGIIATHFVGESTAGIAVMGTMVLVFLVIAIGRNLRVSEGGDSPGPKGASPSDRGGRPLGAFEPPQPGRRPQG